MTQTTENISPVSGLTRRASRVSRNQSGHEPDETQTRVRQQHVRAVGTRIAGINWLILLWNALTLPCVGLIYWVINAQGIRAQMPVFGLRLYKLPLPGFSYLREYEGFFRLDLAHVFAIFLLFAVWYLWIVVVKSLLYGHDAADSGLNKTAYFSFVYALAGIIILGDAIIFFCGLYDRVDSLWTEASSAVPVIATVLYMAVLAFVALVHVHLAAQHQARLQ